VVRRVTLRAALATLGVIVVVALSATGCVAVPSGGPVQSYPVSQQGADSQAQPFIQVQPPSPRPGWDPKQVVQGFLLASASFGTYGQVVNQYLTPEQQKTWKTKTNWSAVVYESGPTVGAPTYPSTAKNPTTATVQVNGTKQASLQGSGSYSVPSAASQGSASTQAQTPYQFLLKKDKGGQWRISQAPTVLLLTNSAFQNDYQLRNLYFFDPMGRHLVPDPVYVPLGASAEELVNGLVRDLNTQPAGWLKGPTKTAFPAGTKVSSVSLDGGVTAVVSLTSSISKVSTPVMEQILAQLEWTLGTVQGGPNGQAAQSVQILWNGKQWGPPATPGNPVQQPLPQYNPPLGVSTKFYYVDSAGYLNVRSNSFASPTRLAKIGTGFSQLAVSPDGKYVAAVTQTGNILYAGLVGRPLAKKGSGYLSVSWDENDDLWASLGSRIVMFRGSASTRQPLGQMVPVTVSSDSYPATPPYSLLKVAPDGVRVAIVQNGPTNSSTLTFGAISGQQGPNPRISLSTVQETPQTPTTTYAANSNFTALAWYGSDDVITLAEPGPAVTMYPVSGGEPISIPTGSNMLSLTTSYKQPLIASLTNGQMTSAPSTTSSWTPITNSDGTPTSGGAPAYPG